MPLTLPEGSTSTLVSDIRWIFADYYQDPDYAELLCTWSRGPEWRAFSVLNARPAPRTPARYAHASTYNPKSSSATTHHTDSGLEQQPNGQ
jgi:hypothetical protein